MPNFDFDQLFIYDLANNHQGDMDHALNIIGALGEVTAEAGVRAALKFQFRQIDTFIHPDYREREDVQHIPRFISTALSREQYGGLTQAVRQAGLLTICTPFDEESVDVIQDLGIEIVKIASCSAADMPLLARVATAGKPVVASTGGLNMQAIDRLVSFFEASGVEFALMHCVALYPTPNDKLNLNQIDLLRNRYPDVPIGFSTHEEPDNDYAVRIAYAKGAQLFERHVGLETDKHKLNSYSSSPAQIARWLKSYREARSACGGEGRAPASPRETESLRSLMRGVYAKNDLIAGDGLNHSNVFFAMPLQEGQLISGQWRPDMVADRPYRAQEAVSEELAAHEGNAQEKIYRIMLQVKGMLNLARIAVTPDTSMELSHHYGLDRFREFGAVLINVINREYCKKILVQLPRQKHPYHYHKVKEETFQLLYGDLEVELEGQQHQMKPGDLLLIPSGAWHKFHTLHGAVFEEISTTHINNDSIYEDPTIARLSRDQRKTYLAEWRSVLNRTAS